MATTPKIKATDSAAPEVAIAISGMNKWYGEFHVLRDINLSVDKGERIVICGPSGSGKSTLIRCINRLEEHQKGQIVVDGIELTNDLKKIDEIRKEIEVTGALDAAQRERLQEIADRCPVHRTLHSEIRMLSEIVNPQETP